MHVLIRYAANPEGNRRLARSEPRVAIVTDEGAEIDVSMICNRVRPSFTVNKVVTCDVRFVAVEFAPLTEVPDMEVACCCS